MPEAMTVEQRLEALEKEVAHLQQQLAAVSEPKKSWIDRIGEGGPQFSDAEAREFMELCAELRRADRPSDEE